MGSKRSADDHAWPGLVASAVSTIVSRAATYPADTLKARLQVQGALQGRRAYKNTFHAFQQVLQTEGLKGFYRGFLPVVAGVLPATMIYFWSYETAKKALQGRFGSAGDFAVGAVAQLTAGIIFTPVDVIKERLQVQQIMGGDRHTAVEATKALLRREGPKGLLRGYWITNSVWIPWTSVYIALYEGSKRTAAEQLSRDSPSDLPGWAIALCSGASAAGAALVTHPLDVVKTRLQVLTANPGMQTMTAARVARDMLQHEGISAFGHGCTARMLQIAPGAAIAWFLYEGIKLRLQLSSE